jgi:hypothetical protein
LGYIARPCLQKKKKANRKTEEVCKDWKWDNFPLTDKKMASSEKFCDLPKATKQSQNGRD